MRPHRQHIVESNLTRRRAPIRSLRGMAILFALVATGCGPGGDDPSENPGPGPSFTQGPTISEAGPRVPLSFVLTLQTDAEVTVTAPGFWTPRIDMHRGSASTTTRVP